jgi:hypothetical protein
MKPARMRIKFINLDIWGWEGAIVLGGTDAQLCSLVQKKLGTHLERSDALGRAVMDDTKPWVLWAKHPKDAATIAHEALHIAFGVLRARGVQPSPKSEESYTYTMCYIVRQALDKKGFRHIR